MLSLAYFVFGPLLLLVAIICADAIAEGHMRRSSAEPPHPIWFVAFAGFSVTVVGFWWLSPAAAKSSVIIRLRPLAPRTAGSGPRNTRSASRVPREGVRRTSRCRRRRFMRLPPLKLVAGLDLARRRDHSALVLLNVAPDGSPSPRRCACHRLRCVSNSP